MATKSDGTIKSIEGQLSGPARAAKPKAKVMAATARKAPQEPGLTHEQLEERQKGFGTKRKDTGPALEGKPVVTAKRSMAMSRSDYVRPTSVKKADEIDLDTLTAEVEDTGHGVGE